MKPNTSENPMAKMIMDEPTTATTNIPARRAHRSADQVRREIEIARANALSEIRRAEELDAKARRLNEERRSLLERMEAAQMALSDGVADGRTEPEIDELRAEVAKVAEDIEAWKVEWGSLEREDSSTIDPTSSCGAKYRNLLECVDRTHPKVAREFRKRDAEEAEQRRYAAMAAENKADPHANEPKVRVRMQTSMAGPRCNLQWGDVADLPKSVADALIEKGRAKRVPAKTPLGRSRDFVEAMQESGGGRAA
jgi:hypothetical protein